MFVRGVLGFFGDSHGLRAVTHGLESKHLVSSFDLGGLFEFSRMDVLSVLGFAGVCVDAS